MLTVQFQIAVFRKTSFFPFLASLSEFAKNIRLYENIKISELSVEDEMLHSD